jgi:hypothetical protein
MLTKATDLCAYINMLSEYVETQRLAQKKLIVSFDIYCLLLEYTALLNHVHNNGSNCTVEELLSIPELVYESPKHQLNVCVNFFLPPGSVDIE